ncbi:MAG TPA: hypothetical protein VMX75_08335 [Spirochaetia bacterium]|nr:hypothetical protein [Spirochaetia bacterium]
MKRLKTSTWVLIGLVVVIAGLGTTLLVLKPAGFPSLLENHRFFSRGEGFSFAPKELRERLEQMSPEQRREFLKEGAEGFGHPERVWIGAHRPGGFLFFVLLIGGAVVLIVVLVRRRNRFGAVRTHSALSILEEQFAEGRISEQEFKRKKTVLEQEGEV